MKRIQKLHLRNFKAFRNQIFDFDGRHVLIYGGNGSGKSSIYWALYTLFEASGKQDIAKYFADPKGTNNPQSLRNINAHLTEASYIKLDWADEVPPINPSTGKPAKGDKKGTFRIAGSTTQSNAYGDRRLREGNQASDFVNYRLFQHFNGSNRHEVNVWPAFVRDIFPYYTVSNQLFIRPEGSDLEGALTYWEALSTVVDKYQAIEPARVAAGIAEKAASDAREALLEKQRLAEEAGGEFGETEEGEIADEVAVERAQETLDQAVLDYQNYLSHLNLDITQFVRRIETNTNNFLSQQERLTGSSSKSVKVVLNYQAPFQLKPAFIEKLAMVPRGEWTAFLRRDQPDELRISLTADIGANSIPRPQTFFNEARLTQLAFALRMGALLDRNPNSSFNVLCLDDVLLSLDMGNRLEILDWLFSAKITLSGSGTRALLKHYQLIFLTHDQELYDLVKHYAKTRSSLTEWYCAQLAWHSRTHAKQPLLFVEGEASNSDLTRAVIHFEAGDYGASGNYLRKVSEKLLQNFLPDEYSRESGGKYKLLDGLIQGLEKLYDDSRMALPTKAFKPFADLMLYKKFHLNPLSHYSPLPLVMQDELWRFISKIEPQLRKLERNEEVIINKVRNAKNMVKIELPLPNGTTHKFQLRLGNEPIYRLGFVVDSPALEYRRSNCLCHFEGELDGTNKLIQPHNNRFDKARSKERLFDVYDELYKALGITQATDRKSVHQVTISSI